MNKFSPRHIVVAAALFGIAAESAWSEDAVPIAPAAPAEQTVSPGSGSDPGYAPAPYQGGYEPYWQPPPRPVPPPGYYGHYPPYYPPQPQYRPAPAAPTEDPLSVELKQAQEQLATKNTELDTAREQLANLQVEQQAIREVLQQAQSEIATATEQLSVVMEQVYILNNVLSELYSRLDGQNISLLDAIGANAVADIDKDSTVTGDAGQAQSPTRTSVQPVNAGTEQTQIRDNEQAKPATE